MTDQFELADPPLASRDRLQGLDQYWWAVLGYGLFSIALGVTLAVWPGETLAVCAVLVAAQLIVGGVLRIVTALSSHHTDPGLRALRGLVGALTVVVGLLCLRDPLQTLTAWGLLLGVWWVVAGFVDVLAALLDRTAGHRLWDAVSGSVSVLAGAFLLVHPELSLTLLVIVICAWLFGVGAFAVAASLRLRHSARDERAR